jgi:hypothetical protein
MTMSATAWSAFRNNAQTDNRLKQYHNMRDVLEPSMKMATGNTYQTTIDFDGYIVDIYTYNQYYEDPTSGALTPYVPAGKVILTPARPIGSLIYAATPQFVPGVNGTPDTLQLKVGDYMYSDYLDVRNRVHEFHIESAGVPVPERIDQIFTAKVVAA